MSAEPQKTVEETPAAAPATETTPAPAESTPTTETPAQPEAPKEETPQETTEAAAAPAAENADKPAEEPKDENKKDEVTPASEGQLGYKAPGLVKSLRFSKRFFYFQDDAVEAKQLAVFHQHEKPAVANPIAAWASQTGKGLFFLTKRAEDKATPAGIFGLADATDLTKEGATEFLFKVNGTKHTFQAGNAAERDSWVAALEAKIADAKSEKEVITGSEGYKAELEKLNKPAGAEAAKKPAENKEEGKEESKEEAAPAEESTENKENKEKSAKSRSQSRKRASLFGSLLGKKEETEEKKEEKPEEAKTEANTEAPAESAQATEAPAEAAPAAETTENKEENKAEQKEENKEEKEEKKEEKKEENKEEKKDDKEEKKDKKAEKSKRSSLFGNFFQKVSSPSQEKTEKEAAAPAESSVASTAPQLDNPVEGAAGKPIEPESVTAPADGETAKDASAAQSPAETPKDKRRTSFFGNFGKKKGDSSDTEDAEGKKGNKLGGLFRKPSKAVKLDNQKEETPADSEAKAEDKPEPVAKDAPAEKPAQEEAKPSETPAEEPKTNNVTSSTPVQAAA